MFNQTNRFTDGMRGKLTMNKRMICRVILCPNVGYHRTFHKGKILCREHHQELIDKTVKEQ